MRILSPSDSGKTFRIDSFSGEVSGKYGARYLYNLVDVKNRESVAHHATKIEYLSGMKTTDKKGSALINMNKGDLITFDYVDGQYPARLWRKLPSVL